ncbi:hypothetical protein AKUH3B101J_14630 [Apilactobacillus kunkeei]|uniref:RNase H type-1 domain-containing protein n=1 Tax=Apilactobacillus kunkeei DSM 12361 = ATCC 700308 TaxID=1423768 RepID=A0A0R1FXV8_9LACO|nr:hypothetical protein [Apilactobacillus kunkeei]KRK23890.1 hypothetical protein FD43_GL001231 [Apilactobacillus kunkeei DSM 12361 = ATCC 700308]MCK8619822.1 hypothetical protein [Apilactobacillus kunkeei]MCK8625630.1 hypothetical protein [Apilactobacillus kunkeei]MCK8636047.1 hypothetical protein [Apilactobacillus kunkeei]QYU53029.1 hypothetical protein K2W83_06970 [Apilactobacillus kunkeei]
MSELNEADYNIRLYANGVYYDNDCIKDAPLTSTAVWVFLIIKDDTFYHVSTKQDVLMDDRLEMLGIIDGLDDLLFKGWQHEHIHVHIMEEHLAKAIRLGWLSSWANNGWKTKDGNKIEKIELMMRLQSLLDQFDNLQCTWDPLHDDFAYSKLSFILRRLTNK